MLDRDSAALDPAELTQSLRKSGNLCTPTRSVRGQEPNGREPSRLLRVRRERPCRSRAAERCNELPPSNAGYHLTVPQTGLRCLERRQQYHVLTPQSVTFAAFSAMQNVEAGTNRTHQTDLAMSVHRGRPEVAFWGCQGRC